MKKYLLVVLALYGAVAAADSQSGKVVGFVPYSVGARELIIFKLEGNASGGCNSTARFAIDSTSPYFKATQAAIIAAFHAQTNMTVVYTQSCNIYPNVWDASIVCSGSVNC